MINDKKVIGLIVEANPITKGHIKIIKEANINLDDINYTVSFKIHIKNKLNEKFVYSMSLNVNLNDDNGGIYNGYVYRGKTTSGKEYRFFKEM